MFSALRIKGERLYKLARKGLEIERSPRQICIYNLKITKFTPAHIYFTVKCSKGTYIRTLCVDLAKKLGCSGHMSQLRRTSCGHFNIAGAFNWDKLTKLSSQRLEEALILR